MHDFQRKADSIKSKLRNKLREIKEDLGGEGRFYDQLVDSVYRSYAIECFIRALSARDTDSQYILKGGALWRAWEDGHTGRPTMDLDMLGVNKGPSNVSLADFRTMFEEIVCDPKFISDTGLIYDIDNMRWSTIKEGVLAAAWRVEGFVYLGEVAKHSLKMPFILEMTYGPAPRDGIKVVEYPPLIDENPVEIPAVVPEWMAADKIHAIVTRGRENTRYKDWYDLRKLFRFRDFNVARFKECLHHVFEIEFEGRHYLPQHADDVIGFRPEMATIEAERAWRTKWVPLWEGRAFDIRRDPPFSAAVAAVRCAMERFDIVETNNAARTAFLLHDLFETARKTELHLGKITDKMANLYDAISRCSSQDMDAAAWHSEGECARRAETMRSMRQIFEEAVGLLESRGLALIARDVWSKRGHGKSMNDVQCAILNRLPADTVYVTVEGSQVTASPKRRRRRKEKQPDKDPEQEVADGLKLMEEATRPDVWIGGLQKVFAAVERGATKPPTVPQPENFAVVAKVWAKACKRAGLEPDLQVALDELTLDEAPVP